MFVQIGWGWFRRGGCCMTKNKRIIFRWVYNYFLVLQLFSNTSTNGFIRINLVLGFLLPNYSGETSFGVSHLKHQIRCRRGRVLQGYGSTVRRDASGRGWAVRAVPPGCQSPLQKGLHIGFHDLCRLDETHDEPLHEVGSSTWSKIPFINGRTTQMTRPSNLECFMSFPLSPNSFEKTPNSTFPSLANSYSPYSASIMNYLRNPQDVGIFWPFSQLFTRTSVVKVDWWINTTWPTLLKHLFCKITTWLRSCSLWRCSTVLFATWPPRDSSLPLKSSPSTECCKLCLNLWRRVKLNCLLLNWRWLWIGWEESRRASRRTKRANPCARKPTDQTHKSIIRKTKLVFEQGYIDNI